MLETERYKDAAKLLEFLLKCKGDDPQVQQEWKALLEWLQHQFVTKDPTADPYDQEKEFELSETVFQMKLEQDQQYVRKLLRMLIDSSSLEKKMLALEQLVFFQDEDTIIALKNWLQEEALHPMLQFKALQVLRQQGANGLITIVRHGKKTTLRIEQTPLQFEDYPLQVRSVFERVQRQSEIDHPNLAYFGEQMWREFLSYIYGTADYTFIKELTEKHPEACAAALHYIALEVTIGPVDVKEVLHQYDVKENEIFLWETIFQMMKQFVNRAVVPETDK